MSFNGDVTAISDMTSATEDLLLKLHDIHGSFAVAKQEENLQDMISSINDEVEDAK